MNGLKQLKHAKKNKIYLNYLLLGVSLLFLLLTVFVILAPTSIFDQEFSEEIQEHNNLFFDQLMSLISWFGERKVATPMAIFCALIFLLSKFKREAIFLLFALSTGLITSVIKLLVNRPRPGVEFVRIVGTNLQQSFPSGHVSFYTVFFGFLIFLMYRLDIIRNWVRITVSLFSILLIGSISISRVYLGAHWLTDVIGGYLLGFLMLYLLIFCYLKVAVSK